MARALRARAWRRRDPTPFRLCDLCVLRNQNHGRLCGFDLRLTETPNPATRTTEKVTDFNIKVANFCHLRTRTLPSDTPRKGRFTHRKRLLYNFVVQLGRENIRVTEKNVKVGHFLVQVRNLYGCFAMYLNTLRIISSALDPF